MQIFAASAKLQEGAADAVDSFLHAGYISAYPRTIARSFDFSTKEPVVELDLVQALRLKGESLGGRASGVDGAMGAISGGSPEWLTILGVVLGFFGVVSLLYLLQDKYPLMRQRWRWTALASVALAGLAVTMCMKTETAPLPTSSPWENAPFKEYEDPEKATVAILNGIIADGIQNIGRPISTLSNIQDEVGLPTRDPTDGMKHARNTYGRDGWGRDFKLTSEEGGNYVVRSAGPDGKYDNSDDLHIRVAQCDDENWEYQRRSLFLREDGGSVKVLFHRFNGKHFEYMNQALAKETTGGILFDLISGKELERDWDHNAQHDKLLTAYNRFAQDATHEPIVLQVFPGSLAP